MLSIPLPFIVGLVFALTLHRNLKGVETPGSRRYFIAFLIMYAVQGMIIGLRFGYGVHWLHFIQPVTASIMPPLAFLAFRALAATPVERPLLHAIGPLIIALSVAFLPVMVDPALMAIFVSYGVGLYRFSMKNTEAVAEAPLPRMLAALRAERLSAIMLFFFGISDIILSFFVFLYGNAIVPVVVTAMNLAVLIMVSIYYFVPELFGREKLPLDAAPAESDLQDDALLEKIRAVLEAQHLYRSESLSLARLSRRVGVPARDVSAVINRRTGLNVSQFVNNRRIMEACRLLEETDKPMMTVMFDAGFATKSNFNREFRRVTGKSPSEWRGQRKSRAGVKT